MEEEEDDDDDNADDVDDEQEQEPEQQQAILLLFVYEMRIHLMGVKQQVSIYPPEAEQEKQLLYLHMECVSIRPRCQHTV